jgi:tripeptide aminopeptidase
MKNVTERFLRYVTIPTQAVEGSWKVPSSDGQIKMAHLLLVELKTIGMHDVQVDDNGYVTATLPSNVTHVVPVVGFIAHMDTSPDFTGEGVKPRMVSNYQGGDIILNETHQLYLKVDEFPELHRYTGQDIITTDGTTLLGADDKAGVAEIVSAMDYLIRHPEIKHGTIRICFTPDEEIGQGADHFDVEAFGADFAYTMDGGEIGELEYENFNAASAHIIIQGRNIHPGYAKGKMLNAITIASKFASLLPADEVPEKTDGYEGFFHLNSINGNVERAEMHYIIRDFDIDSFEKRKQLMIQAVEQINNEYGLGTAQLVLKDQYFNMREKVEPVQYIVDLAKEAMVKSGIEPVVKPIRGGTDGARLSYMGLPTPNIFAGGHNFHGRYEFVPVQSMEKAVEVIVNISSLLASRNI